MAKNQVMADMAVRISTQTAELKKGLKQASGQVQSFTNRAKKASKEFSAGFKGAFSSVAGTANPALGGMINMLGGAKGAMTALTKGTSLLRIGLASTGIGLIVIALGSLVTWLNTTKEGMLVMSRATEVVGAVIGVVIDTVAALGGAVMKVIAGDFKGAWEQASGAIDGVGGKMVEVGKKADGIAKDEDANTKKEIKNKKAIAALLVKNGELRIKARDTDKFTADQRVGFAAEELKNLREINAMKMESLNDEVDILERRQDLGNNTLEDDQELADLQVARAAAQKGMLGQEKELMMLGQDVRRQRAATLKSELAIVEAKKAQNKELSDSLEMTGKNVGGTDIGDGGVKKNQEENDAKAESDLAAMNEFVTKNKEKLAIIAEDQLAHDELMVSQAQMVAGIVSSHFSEMGKSIVGSWGLASSGFEGFIGQMASTAIKIASMALSNSLANAIQGATQSGTATGPAAIFTTPGFIATAVAGVMGAFAAIPKFAMGGVVGRNGRASTNNQFSLATVGERGRETVALPRGSRVISHADSMRAISQGNTKKLNIAVQDIIIEGEDLRVVLGEADRIHSNSF
jgi:hypothetical protein